MNVSGPSRGYILEVFNGHFQLPNLGAIGERLAGTMLGTVLWSGRAIGSRRLHACAPPHDPTAPWGVHSPAIPVDSRAGFPTPYT